MFGYCRALTYIDLHNFDTSSVTSMERMFYNCESLKYINLEGWDTSKVKNMSYMFCDCKLLVTIEGISDFDTSNVTNMECMFSNCESLTSLDLHCVKNEGKRFYANPSGYRIHLLEMFEEEIDEYACIKWNTYNVINMSQMFSNCVSLTYLDISDWYNNMDNNTEYMFCDCKSLRTINFGNMWFSHYNQFRGILNGCPKDVNLICIDPDTRTKLLSTL